VGRTARIVVLAAGVLASAVLGGAPALAIPEGITAGPALTPSASAVRQHVELARVLRANDSGARSLSRVWCSSCRSQLLGLPE